MKEILYERVTGRSQEVVIRPAEPMPAQTRMTIRLRPDQRAWLDDLSSDMARTTGTRVAPAAIIRAVLDGVADARLALSGCRSEADVRAAVVGRLRRR